MRIYELLTALVEDAVPGNSDPGLAAVAESLSRAEITLTTIPLNLTDGVRQEMLHSLRQMLEWRARLGAEKQPLDNTAQAWAGAQVEMLRRFSEDKSAIREAFFGGQAPGEICSIAVDLSDPHDKGSAVAILTFASGLKLVYKPREMAIEGWFYDLLAWLNQTGAPQSFATLKTLCRAGYGWMEFAAHRRCDTPKELAAYYGRAGALLCLLSLLRASDCHFQNIVACGEYPALIDAETLFHPCLAAEDAGFSVAHTGMLPPLPSAARRMAANLGALSCVSPQTLTLPLLNDANAAVTLTPEESLPFPEGQQPAPQDFAAEMAAGFAAAYGFLVQHRDAVAEKVEAAAKYQVRYLLRDTPEYYQAMVAMAFRRGSKQDAPSPLPPAKFAFEALCSAEAESLTRFEIPRFTLSADSRDLCGVHACFAMSGHAAVVDAIAKLSEEEMQRQLKLLRISWSIYGSLRALA
jgi:lantibiotic modifying enzyme